MTNDADIDVLVEASLGEETNQLRAAPLRRADEPDAILLVHSGHGSIDPANWHFTFPTDTLKLSLLEPDGEVRWRTDLGEGVVPGVWFCPVFPFDLDGDGTEEVWAVTTDDPRHPFNTEAHELERFDAETGESTGTWNWPAYPPGRHPVKYRNFVFGGHVGDDPVLVTAQGTYADMYLQAWNPDMSRRWEREIDAWDPNFFETTRREREAWIVAVDDEPHGARGSHMTPILDIDGDGDDELLWGERLIDLDTGEEIWCADRDTWHGHSDIVQPTFDRETDDWYVYTCRETYTDVSPRVAMYDDRGERVWTAIEEGHMHVGWTARLGGDGEFVAMTGRGKVTSSRDPDPELNEFTWRALTGEAVDLPYPVYSTAPVDLNGDGVHELVYGAAWGGFGERGRVIDSEGNEIGNVGSRLATVQFSKLIDHPGEQIVTYQEDGTVKIWGDRNAEDTDAARRRYDHPYYRKSTRLSAVGYNWRNLGGL